MSKIKQLEHNLDLLQDQVERIPLLQRELHEALLAIARLRSQNEWLKRHLYGRRSERHVGPEVGDQPELFEGDDA